MSKRRSILVRPAALALFSLALAASSMAQRIYVDAAAANGGNGSSWSKAYNKLGTALAAAKSGAEVWVAKGLYTGGFSVPGGVSLYGGFASGDVRMSERDFVAKRTTLHGNDKQRVLSVGTKVLIDGFVLERGNAGDNLGGGGLAVEKAVVTMRNCIVTDCRNSGGRAAAIHVLAGGDLTLENVVVTKSRGFGHAIDVTTAKITATHLVVHGNNSNGFHVHGGSVATVRNSVFTKNTGRGICHISSTDRMLVENNLFDGNGVSHYHIQGRELRSIAAINALSYAKNNIGGAPKFVDPAKLDFRLQSSSPAVDAGQRASVMGDRGLYGQPRWLDGKLNGSVAPDLGASEFSNAMLEMIGTPTPGKSVQLVLRSGGLKAAFVVFAGRPAKKGLFVDPLGHALFDLGSGFVILPLPLNAGLTVVIPSGVAKGTSAAFQTIGLGGSGLNLGNLIDMRVR